jgi:hypothetical protein
MVLFEFDKIMREKYNNYKTNKPETVMGIEFEQFYQIGLEQITEIFHFYFTGINPIYVIRIVQDTKNKIIFSCIDEKFNLKNVTSILVYHKTKPSNKTKLLENIKPIKYYVLVLGTHERFRKFGYGKIIIDEFVQWIKQTDNSVLSKKILLKSLESSLKFYQEYGFVCSELEPNKLFYKYENADELKNNQEKILELNIE